MHENGWLRIMQGNKKPKTDPFYNDIVLFSGCCISVCTTGKFPIRIP